MSDRPTFVPLWLRCGGCGHNWNGWQPSGVPIKVWTTHVQLLRCPSCGAGPRGLLIQETPPAPPGFVE